MGRYTKMSDDPVDPKYRIAVDDEGTGLINIDEERLTSANLTAQTTEIPNGIALTTDQAVFVYESLGKLLAERGEIPYEHEKFARSFVKDLIDLGHVEVKTDIDKVAQLLARLLFAQRAAGEVTGIAKAPAGPEDMEIVFAALAAMVEDIHAPQDNLTISQWERAEDLFREVTAKIEDSRKA